MSALRMFIPIVKVDGTRRLVYGVATAEMEDRAGEICDYASTKPLYEKWSQEIAKATGGKSFGNLRAMHGNVAAGKVTKITFNDAEKKVEICAKVVDDVEWLKVQEGVYTGFSQGGVYERRWQDTEGRNRYTAAPSEISLVDLPCLPEATFEMIKTDGTIEKRSFGKGFEETARLKKLIEELNWLRDDQELGEMIPPDDTGKAADTRQLFARTLAILRTMVGEETDLQASLTMFDAPPKSASLKSVSTIKRGPGGEEADQAKMQHLRDSSENLGAICTTQSQRGIEKRFDLLADTLADVLCRLKNIEEQPFPLPFLGQPRVISKADDVGDESSSGNEKLLSNPDALSVLAIKLAQRNGRPPLR
ncbi:hypothetical protein QEV83_05100 [Methylocapsa sp. D3K7]|uniref:hypothetical protein n=1 Tax=Methylocapsa sp. D3K7 TaxID=3041435 RepID=UPI00244EA147|nr:hypothetical protein [Methylocapsa sp. D3K7]WGJ15644.1 hypothetical protein QEV83_05100 [Methylocapsa sp. D3K7]